MVVGVFFAIQAANSNKSEREGQAALLALSVIGLRYLGWKRFAPDVGTPTVTVVAADSSRASSDLAGDLLIKLAKLQ